MLFLFIIMAFVGIAFIGRWVAERVTQKSLERYLNALGAAAQEAKVGPIRITHLRCETCDRPLQDGQMAVTRGSRMDHLACMPTEFQEAVASDE